MAVQAPLALLYGSIERLLLGRTLGLLARMPRMPRMPRRMAGHTHHHVA